MFSSLVLRVDGVAEEMLSPAWVAFYLRERNASCLELGVRTFCSRVASFGRQMAAAIGLRGAQERVWQLGRCRGAAPKSRKTRYLSGGKSAKGRKTGLSLPGAKVLARRSPSRAWTSRVAAAYTGRRELVRSRGRGGQLLTVATTRSDPVFVQPWRLWREPCPAWRGPSRPRRGAMRVP